MTTKYSPPCLPGEVLSDVGNPQLVHSALGEVAVDLLGCDAVRLAPLSTSVVLRHRVGRCGCISRSPLPAPDRDAVPERDLGVDAAPAVDSARPDAGSG